MYYSVSYNSIACVSAGYKKSDYSGSSSYIYENQRLTKKPQKRTANNIRYMQAGKQGNPTPYGLEQSNITLSDDYAYPPAHSYGVSGNLEKDIVLFDNQ